MASSKEVDHRAKRLRASKECLAIGKCSKSTLSSLLKALHNNGMLKNDMGSQNIRSIRCELQKAQESHAYSMTPYGKVVERVALPFDALPTWDIADPRAQIYHLSKVSEHFAELMASVCKGDGQALRILLYADETVPGNPLRHDKGRSLWAIYWAMLDWPEWVLARSESWPCFAVVQSKICDRIPGWLASLMPYVLKAFWPGTCHNHFDMS